MTTTTTNKPPIKIPKAFRGLFKPARYKAFYGGRGSAKSHSIAAALLLTAGKIPIRVACYREIQKSIRDSSKRLLDDKIAALGYSYFFESTQNEIRGKNGSLFIFGGLRSNPEAVKSTEGLDIAWVEEAATVSQTSLDILVPTLRKPGSELWFSWNPRFATDPVDAMFRGGEPPPNSIIKRVNFDRNPFFPQVLRDEMEWDKRRDPDKYKHIWLGEYQSNSEARVFKNWRIGDRDEFQQDPSRRYYYGADWGFSVDPTVLIRCYIEGRTLFVDREVYKVGCEIDATPALFDQVPGSRKWPIRADSARPETISYMNRQGFQIVSALKGAGSVEDGVEFLKSHDIVVHPDCRHTIDELSLYSYKVDKLTNEVLPVLQDKQNHCIAKGTLVICERGYIPIEDVTTQDRVLTRRGFRRVLFSGQTDSNRKTVIVKTTVGSVVCTPDHEIFTQKGFTRADALRYGDEITGAEIWLKSENGTGANTAAIQTASTNLTGSIFHGMAAKAQNTFTGIFGNTTTVRFLKDMRSITKMVTRQITRLKISNACLHQNTRQSIPMMGIAMQNRLSILKKYGPLLKSGTSLKKVGQSIEKLVQRLMPILYQSQNLVGNAEQYLHQERSATLTNFAQMPANQLGDGLVARTTSINHAQFAGDHSLPTNMPTTKLARGVVLTVSEGCVAEKVYDLTVEEDHEFFAEGILVHNCIDSLRYALEGARRSTVQPSIRRF